MRQHVQMLLELIGMPRNEVQVFEDTDFTGSFIYPNFFTSVDYSGSMSDSALLDEIEDMIQEHLETTKKELELVRIYKKTFYGEDNSDNTGGSTAVV